MTTIEGPAIGTLSLSTVVDPVNPRGIVDLINNSSIAILNSATTGTIGGVTAFSFNGDDPSGTAKLVRINNVLNTGTSDANWCMETWCYFINSVNQNVIHMSGDINGNSWCLPPIHVDSNRITGVLWNNGPYTVQDTEDIVLNKWYHVILTWDSTNYFRLFVNGVLKSTNSYMNHYTASGSNNYCFLGGATFVGCSNSKTKNLNGGIGYFSFRNKLMTQIDVDKQFNSLRGRFSI